MPDAVNFRWAVQAEPVVAILTCHGQEALACLRFYTDFNGDELTRIPNILYLRRGAYPGSLEVRVQQLLRQGWLFAQRICACQQQAGKQQDAMYFHTEATMRKKLG